MACGTPARHKRGTHTHCSAACRILIAEAPDVIDALGTRGVHQVPVVVGAGAQFFVVPTVSKRSSTQFRTPPPSMRSRTTALMSTRTLSGPTRQLPRRSRCTSTAR